MNFEIERVEVTAKPRELKAKWTVDWSDMKKLGPNYFEVVERGPNKWELHVSLDIFHKVNDALTQHFGRGSRNSKSVWRASWSEFSHEKDECWNSPPQKYKFFIKDPQVVAFITLLFG